MPERELPEMVTDLVDLTKVYVEEEVVAPARSLGRYAGAVIGSGILMSLGALLLSIAAFRAVATWVMPEGPYWSALAYVATAALLLVVAWLLVRRVTARST